MKQAFVLAIISALILVLGCKKENKPPTEEPYTPTPYKLEYPKFVTKYLGDMPIPADNPLTVEGVELGRLLFYDKKLSDNQSMSCASCHNQAFSFDDDRAFSEGTNGAMGSRNAMAIVNLGWSSKFFWDGRRNSLEEQAHDPVTNPIEMRNTWPVVVERLQNDPAYPELFRKAFGTRIIDSDLVVKAIAQFERTLISFDSPYDRYYFNGDLTALNESEMRGFEVFSGKADCDHCHSDVLMTDNAFRNNGLDMTHDKDKGRGVITGNASDDGKFKVPTLRNIAQSAPYMHDSRFKTLEEVVDYYDHGVNANSPNIDLNMEFIQGGLNLTAQEKQDLVNFLKALTDESFLTNPKFSQP